jgi:lipopolysaccharide assembly protein B
MQFEFWWLLALPLLFAAGWFAAKMDGRQALRQSRHLPEAYFKGLNFLLNEQSDKAIDAFTEVVQIDPETSELHFALGNLFRRRGETERAIRVHQNLVNRTDLTNEQRQHALFELGQDYLKAGLLDRAQDQFNRLEGSEYAVAALRHRLSIAQLLREWDQAIEFATTLRKQPGVNAAELDGLIAHFHCELALIKNNQASPRALAQLQKALQVCPSAARPRLLQAQHFAAAGEWSQAQQALVQLAKLAPNYLALAPQLWIDAFRELGQGQDGLNQLSAVFDQSGSVDLLAAIAAEIERQQGPQAALAWTRQALGRSPSLLGLGQLFGVGERAGTQFEDLSLAKNLVNTHAKRLGRYTCRHCGFRAQQYYWQCPGCQHWDSTEPRRTEEQELAG